MTDHRKTAVYIRLSAEDDNVDGRAKKESDSVTSQRILLKSFVIDELGVAESDILEYVDDGVSGTHFKRQGFQQLQDDMKSGEIGCVVVKDFSRFGRDYLEVGFYNYTADFSTFHVILQLLKSLPFKMSTADTIIHIFQDIRLSYTQLINHK